jgi:hypothetical protein
VAIEIAIVVVVPAVVVFNAAVRAIPVAGEVVATIGIPISVEPYVTGTRGYRTNPQHSWGWRRPDADSERNLAKQAGACGKCGD